MSAPDSASDELLLARLRDLALVDLDALLAGATGQHHDELLRAYAEDLADALAAARERARGLLASVTAGPDVLAFLDAGIAARARDGGHAAGERVSKRLAARAAACRALARLDDLVAHVLPRLLEADRRRAALGS